MLKLAGPTAVFNSIKQSELETSLKRKQHIDYLIEKITSIQRMYIPKYLMYGKYPLFL